jgi:hypothetical protein
LAVQLFELATDSQSRSGYAHDQVTGLTFQDARELDVDALCELMEKQAQVELHASEPPYRPALIHDTGSAVLIKRRVAFPCALEAIPAI